MSLSTSTLEFSVSHETQEPFHSDIHGYVTTTPTKPLPYVGAPFDKAKLGFLEGASLSDADFHPDSVLVLFSIDRIAGML
jgi:hypothetical protein